MQNNRFFAVIVHNVRSAYNVGSIFRSADCAGVNMIYISGYSPSPARSDSVCLTNSQKMIAKTALGAENYVDWKRVSRIGNLLRRLKDDGFEIVALEQDEKSIEIESFKPKSRIALIVGNEPRGINSRVLNKCDSIMEIPMMGGKKSLNVSVAFGIAAFDIYSKIK